jgi:ribonuclease HII
MARPRASRTLENAVRRRGYGHVAGVDEVGRGCLAGPVAAGAVVLDPGRYVPGIADSKVLTADERERLFDQIVDAALCWQVTMIEPAEIDRINIHRASLEAMRRAVLALVPAPDYVLVDGFGIPDLPIEQQAIPGGDRRCTAIAAASILAKVTRDRLMRELHVRDPRYGFDRHKGYATAAHLAAVLRFGYSDAHRKTFRPPTLFDTIADDDARTARSRAVRRTS